ncbi:MAG: M13 family metallopeptidase [Bacteroidota bacterium]
MIKVLVNLIAISLILASCVSTKKNESEKQIYGTINTEYLDPNVKPQEDFFQFANGNWIKNTEIPSTESRWGSFNELDLSNKKKLIDILENAKNNPGEKGSQNQILGDYYSSYMNMELRNSKGIKGIEAELLRIQEMNRKDFLVEIIAEHHKDGINSIFGFGIGQDLKNVSKNIAYLSQGGLGLPNKDYYLDEKKKDLLNDYERHISWCFQAIGKSQEQADDIAQHVLTFEKQLASVMLSKAEMRIPEKTYNKKSLREITTMTGTFDFRYYLNLVGCSSPDSIVVDNPTFIRTISEMVETTDMYTWKHYLSWKVLRHYAKHLDQKFVDLNFEFYGKKLSGKKTMKPLNESAIDEITDMEFAELLGKAFVDKHFSKQAQDRVNLMVDNLLIVFQDRIKNLEWMSETTKKEALNKLNSIGRKLGFPSKWEDFSKLNFTSNDYLANIKEVNRYAVKKNFEELSKPVDKEKWGMPAHMVNAYYHPLLNEIAFPAGIMQPPFFDDKAEDAVNYGRIGMVIGHEFTHGFDDMGSKFAADGTFKNWWTDEDRNLFEEKTKILGETYAVFCPLEGNCVNPDLTMGENIADLGGLTMAYYAYTRTDEFKKNEFREGYSPSQRFFIAYAQLWKIKYTDEEMKNRIANDPHSPGMYRVNGPLKNCPEFFNSFSVEENRPMRNSSKKIAKIW